jgi:hypothetical protein
VPAGASAAAELPLRPLSPPADSPGPLSSSAPEETGGALRVFLGALAVLLVVGGGLGWLFLGPGSKKAALIPQDPGPVATAAPAGPGVPEPTPAPDPEPEPTAVPTPAPPTPPPTPPPTVAPTGTAVVSSNVYAQVSIDGKPRGGVLQAKRFTLPPGRYVASFESGGFGPIRMSFEVAAGASVPVVAEFPPLGQLAISVSPDAVGAELLVDGIVVGRAGNAPLRKTVAAGDRRVEARLPGFAGEAKTVVVAEEETTEVLLTLRRN